MDAVTLGQLRTFLAVAQSGGFSAAAKVTGKSQSAITYAIAKLEDQTGLLLFDRNLYRPELTAEGLALVTYAQRIIDDFKNLSLFVASVAQGQETEITLAFDPAFPMRKFLQVMRAFSEQFPLVRTRVYAENMAGGAQRLSQGSCDLSIGVAPAFGEARFERLWLEPVQLAMVAAPSHPLARGERAPSMEEMRQHIQLVLSDPTEATRGKDFSVFSDQTWRLGDIGTKHAILLQGFGFGTMPFDMVEQDLSAGRLVRLYPTAPEWGNGGPLLPMCVAWLKAEPRGPACRWLIEKFAS